MTEYRCHYLIGDRVQGVKMFVCHSDAEMVVHANELLDFRHAMRGRRNLDRGSIGGAFAARGS